MKVTLSLTLSLLFSVNVLAQAASFSVPDSRTINSKQLLDDLRILSANDMEGRKPDTKGSAKAREYIVRRFKDSGIKPFGESYLQEFTFSFNRDNEVHHGVNVIGYIEGTKAPDRYIVVSAHYDHLGIRNGQIYNGADDNGSGTASLFALARYFSEHRPANSMIFAAFDAEEAVRFGGAYNFLQRPPVKEEQMVMNVNIDMIARDKNDTVYMVGTHHYPFLKPYLETVVAQSRVKLLFGHDDPANKKLEDWTSESDHGHFHARKIPFIYFGVEDNEQHHQPTDDFETISPNLYVGAVESIVLALAQFDSHLTEIVGASLRGRPAPPI
ncbi:MAG: peptidase M20 [Blastocatellia bacterium]|nr:MAG: peptidase M20 [Blastocatellia bacterium]